MEYKVGTQIKDIKVICENSVELTEQKVKDAIKDGWQYESVMNGCPGSCPGSCILMVDRRLPLGEEIII
jgi:hypothetical protein